MQFISTQGHAPRRALRYRWAVQTDAELLERWGVGDEHAGNELLRRHVDGWRVSMVARAPPTEWATDFEVVGVEGEIAVGVEDRWEGAGAGTRACTSCSSAVENVVTYR